MCWGAEELHTRTASGRRRGDVGEALPPSTFPFVPPCFALAAKALLGYIGWHSAQKDTGKGAGSQWHRSSENKC